MSSHVGYPKEILDIDLMNEYYDGLQFNSENYPENYLRLKLFMIFLPKSIERRLTRKTGEPMEELLMWGHSGILMKTQFNFQLEYLEESFLIQIGLII